MNIMIIIIIIIIMIFVIVSVSVIGIVIGIVIVIVITILVFLLQRNIHLQRILPCFLCIEYFVHKIVIDWQSINLLTFLSYKLLEMSILRLGLILIFPLFRFYNRSSPF